MKIFYVLINIPLRTHFCPYTKNEEILHFFAKKFANVEVSGNQCVTKPKSPKKRKIAQNDKK